MSAWGRNAEVIAKRWPRILPRLSNAKLDGIAITENTPVPGLVFEGLQITSGYNRAGEAAVQCLSVPKDANEVFCYGVGLGDLPRMLVAQQKKTIAVFMNAAIGRASFTQEVAEWLKAPNIHLEFAGALRTLYRPFACVPQECRLADDQGYAMRDRIFGCLHDRANRDLHFETNREKDTAHVVENLKRSDKDKPVSSLFGVRSHGHFAVIGGGPSLSGQLEWLATEQREHGLTLVAASTALKPLAAAGIIPDIVCVIDTERDQVKHLIGLDLSRYCETTLVYDRTVQPEFMSAWQGPCYYLEQGHPERTLFISGTVVHAQVDLSYRMGANQITLVGCDFCYPSGKSHAIGADDEQLKVQTSLQFKTLDGNGNQTFTDPNLARYHRHLEQYITNRPGVRFNKRGRAGVPISGATWTG